jgi:hypothetical protein
MNQTPAEPAKQKMHQNILNLNAYKYILETQKMNFEATLSNCLAFSTMARSFCSDNKGLPFIFGVTKFFSVN